MKKGALIFLSICWLAAMLVSCGGQGAGAVQLPEATPGCDKGFSHLSTGETITVIEVGHPNRVRATPHVTNDNVIGQISAGMSAKIVDGPVCADGMVFWKVVSQSIPSGTGWTAEGNGAQRWLEQYQP
ncbi:MAG TPA: hypothetical protein VMT91_07205 [Anaerolineales bacterium]|nr:hypothetical protein [Anaerolineales bacterium]